MRKLNFKQRENIDGFIFILPALAFFLIFRLYPFIYSFYLSLHVRTGVGLRDIEFAWFDQYRIAFQDPQFFSALRNTIVYTAIVVFFHLVLGLLLAVLLNRAIIAKSAIRAMFFTPVVLSTIICGIIWNWMYSPDAAGMINRVIGLVGIPPIAWLRDPNWAMISIAFMGIWKWVGFHMVIYLAALQGIPNDYYEAASLEGAGGLQKFTYITFPLLAPATWLLLITSIINTFQVFDQIFVMTGGGPIGSTTVLVFLIYQIGFVRFDLPYASAVAWMMFIVIFIFTLIQMIIQTRSQNQM